MKKNSKDKEVKTDFSGQEVLVEFGVLVNDLNSYASTLREASHVKFVSDMAKRVEYERVKLESFLKAIGRN